MGGESAREKRESGKVWKGCWCGWLVNAERDKETSAKGRRREE